MNDEFPILEGEEWWSSKAIDDTDSVVRSLLKLTNSCVELNINLEHSKQLQAELSLNSDNHNIDIVKWLAYCSSLSETIVSEEAEGTKNELNIYLAKYIKN